MTFPDPVIEVAIEPKTKSDQEKLSLSIQKLAEEDPTFKVHQDVETGQDRDRRHGRAAPGHPGGPDAPRVQGRGQRRQAPGGLQETIRRKVDKVEYTHKKQTGGSGQFARCSSPLSRSAARTVPPTSSRTRSPVAASAEYIPSVDAGARDAMQYGVLAGYPLVNLKVTLLDGAYHDVDSSEMAFKVAGSQALKKAAGQAQPVILEPIMAVEVTAQAHYMGDVIGDLNSAVVRSRPWRSVRCGVVKAHVPLSEMFGYVGDLRSKTQGQANYSMVFDSYAEVPAQVSEIIARATGA